MIWAVMYACILGNTLTAYVSVSKQADGYKTKFISYGSMNSIECDLLVLITFDFCKPCFRNERY
jgi:hypothetical protein